MLLTLFLSALSVLSLHEGLLSASAAAAAAAAALAVADEAADDTEDVEPEDWAPEEATNVAVAEATVVVAVEPEKRQTGIMSRVLRIFLRFNYLYFLVFLY